MELDDVRTFVSVAQSGSVSLAARALHITQPAVTRRLQRLENSLCATLLDRTVRPFALTAIGQATLERCHRLLHDVREVRAAASNAALQQTEMRIGVAHALTELTLTQPVDELRKQFPKTNLRLSTGWSRELLARLRSGVIDAAVILLPRGESLPAEIRGHVICEERLVVLSSRKNSRSVARIRDLAGVPWILNPEGCAARAALRKALSRADVDLIVAVEAYSYELQLSLVAQHRGLSLVPERIYRRSRIRGRLRVLRVPELDFPLTAWVVHRENPGVLEELLIVLNRALKANL